MAGLYLHIPFCKSKCRYCDFYSRGGQSAVPDAYVAALLRELAQKPGGYETVYFGGGTPSLLAPQQIETLLAAANPAPQAEITLEVNPDTVALATLRAYRAAGVNRLSVGVQTANDASLARLGRRHTAAAARQALQEAAQAGFDNISGDLMLALPQYSQGELADTVSLLAEYCTHVSAYLLKIEQGTAFGKNAPEGLPSEDAAADFYLAAVETLARHGFIQYEISNFARHGFESRHNLLYWNCADYDAIGPAAHGAVGGKRFYTAPDTNAFLAAPAEYVPDGDVSAEDFIMLQLRLSAGLSLPALAQRFGVHFTPKQQQFAKTLAQNGFAHFDGATLALTPQGMLIQNSILCELL